MTYAISKEFGFCAAHFLRGLPPSHPCSSMHGHNYKVKIEIMTEEVDEVGFVLDYRELDHVKHDIDHLFDHQCVNDVLQINPTAENLAKWLWGHIMEGKIGQVLTEKHGTFGLFIHVSETDKTWASYDGTIE